MKCNAITAVHKELNKTNLFKGVLIPVLMMLIFSAPGVSSAEVVTIGTGTIDTTLPMDPYYGYTYSQSIYLKSNINVTSAIIIDSIEYYFDSTTSYTDAVVIYMGNTTTSSFASTSSWISVANMTQVYNANWSYGGGRGWKRIRLSTPFTYDNVGNLVVAFDENTSGYHGRYDSFHSTEQGTNRSIWYRSDSSNPNPSSPPTGTRTSRCANIKIYYHTEGTTYTLTMSNDGNGTTTPSGAVTVNQGDPTNITATPNTGYNFFKWTVTSGTAAIADTNSASTTVTLNSGNATVRANFAIKTYQLTTAATSGGSVTAPVTNPTTVNHGVPTTITASANTGYNFVKWTITSGTATIADTNSASTTVTLTSGNATVQANFALKTYQLTVNVGTGGTRIAPPMSPITVNHGAATVIHADPLPGYNFVNWTVESGTATIANANVDSTTVTLTTGNATVQANFTANTYQLTVNAGTGGTRIAPATSPVIVNHGATTVIHANPVTGFNFVNWTVVSGTAAIANTNADSTTVTLSAGNAAVQANFALKTYTLTITSVGNGTTTPSGALTVSHGVPRAISATPSNGYGFVGWTVTSGQAAIEDQYAPSTNATLTNGDATIEAAFSRSSYTLTITVNGDGWVNPAGPIDVNINDSVLLNATPEEGSRFSEWSVTEGKASVSKPVLTASYVKLLNSDAKVTANFISAAECTTSSRTFAICGHLTDSAGQPVGNSAPQTKDAVVRLFTTPAGGDTVYQESFLQADGNAATVDRGVFIVRLGKGVSQNDVQKVIRSYNTLYAEIGIITINGEQTLLPRLPLNASAYSIAGAVQQPMRGAGNPDTRNLTALFGTYYINDLDNTTWMKTQNGWGKIGN